MKILICCNHGNVRSVALKYLIQRVYGHDILAAGVEENSPETLEKFRRWADRVIVLTPEAYKIFPEAQFIDVGHDVWKNPFAQELQHKLLKHMKDLHLDYEK